VPLPQTQVHRRNTVLDRRHIGSIVHLGTSAKIDPFLRSFYSFNSSNQFQSSLHSFRSLGQGNNLALFLETPRRVTDSIANLLEPAVELEEPLLKEMEPYGPKLIALFNQFVQPYYLARLLIDRPRYGSLG
jgi:hypothetical protein